MVINWKITFSCVSILYFTGAFSHFQFWILSTCCYLNWWETGKAKRQKVLLFWKKLYTEAAAPPVCLCKTASCGLSHKLYSCCCFSMQLSCLKHASSRGLKKMVILLSRSVFEKFWNLLLGLLKLRLMVMYSVLISCHLWVDLVWKILVRF